MKAREIMTKDPICCGVTSSKVIDARSKTHPTSIQIRFRYGEPTPRTPFSAFQTRENRWRVGLKVHGGEPRHASRPAMGGPRISGASSAGKICVGLWAAGAIRSLAVAGDASIRGTGPPERGMRRPSPDRSGST